MHRQVTGGLGRPAHLGKNVETQKKSKFQIHLRKKVKKLKVVFLQINLALATQKCNKINFRGQNRAKTYF